MDPMESTVKLIMIADWETEVKQTVERALTEEHDVDIAALELNTLKMAMNINFDNLRQVVIPALLSRIDPSKGSKPMKIV